VTLVISGCGVFRGRSSTGSNSGPSTNHHDTSGQSGRSNAADLRRSAGRALVIAPDLEPLNAPPSTVASNDQVSPKELRPPTCINLPPLEADNIEVDATPVIDCDKPHSAQIYWAGSLDDNLEATYPGYSTVLSVSDQICLDSFQDFVGVQYVDSDLEILHLRPDEVAWERGNRVLICLVQHRHQESLTGSAKDSRW